MTMRYAMVMMLACLGPVAHGQDAGNAAIQVGEETTIFADGPGKGIQATPHVAYGKDQYLAVWREGWHGKGGNARIFAARLDASGKVKDAKGIEVGACAEKACVQEYPRVAFAGASGGGVFLVVWQDLRNGKDYDILGARVSADGKVLDAEPLRVGAGPRTQALADVASDGKGFLVAWQGLEGESAGYEGFAAMVSADGQVGTPVKTGASPQVRIASGENGYAAIFGSTRIHAAVLGADGKPAGNKKGEEVMRCKSAAFSVSGVPGKGWLVIGQRSPPDPWGWGGPGGMRCAILKPDGAVENPTKKEPAGNWKKLENWLDVGGRDRKTWPYGESASVWDGKQSIAVWPRHHITGEKKSDFTNCDLMASRVDGWKPLDAGGIPVAATGAEESDPALASDGAGKCLCVYEKGEGGRTFICARVLESR